MVRRDSAGFNACVKCDLASPSGTGIARLRLREAEAAEIASVKARLSQCSTDPQAKQSLDLEPRRGAIAQQRHVVDIADYIDYLAQAIQFDAPELFLNYVAWAKIALLSRGFDQEQIANTLRCIASALSEPSPESSTRSRRYVDAALEALPEMPSDVPGSLEGESGACSRAQSYLQALLAGDRLRANSLIQGAAEEGESLESIYLDIFEPVQCEIGRLWQQSRINVAQEHFCTALTQTLMAQLTPRFVSRKQGNGKVVAACVNGELHEIGLRMCTDLLELDGWSTRYLGASTPIRDIATTVSEQSADILAISVTIAANLATLLELIEIVRSSSGNRTKIIVGGLPFKLLGDLWKRVGSDGFATNAADAVRLARRLFEETAADGN